MTNDDIAGTALLPAVVMRGGPEMTLTGGGPHARRRPVPVRPNLVYMGYA